VVSFRHGRFNNGATRLVTVIALACSIAMVVGVQACRDTAVTQPVKKTAAVARIMCDDGTFDCFCRLFGTNCPDNPPPVSGDSTRVWCTPRTVVRGADVTCRIYVGERRPFEVLERLGDSMDTTVVMRIVGGRDPLSYEPGDTATWSGAMVVSTRVSIAVRMADSAGNIRTLPFASDSIIVTPRPFSPYEIASVPTLVRGVEHHSMTEYPLH